MRGRCQWAAEPAVTRESEPSITCPSVSSHFSLLATRLYAAVFLVFLIIGVIILIFPAKIKGVGRIFYKKISGASRPMRQHAPNPAATRPRSPIETYSTFGILVHGVDKKRKNKGMV